MAIQPEGLRRIQQDMAEDGNIINTPPQGDSGIADSPGLEGSFQQLLADNLGHYVQIDFLVGVQTLVRRSGIIYAVGRSFVVLYDETNRNFVMCDVFSAKFVAFFATRPAPGVLPNNPMGIMAVDAQGNLWPVEHMEPPRHLPGGWTLVQPQGGAGSTGNWSGMGGSMNGMGGGTGGAIPPQDAATTPGWVTWNDQAATDRQARGNFF